MATAKSSGWGTGLLLAGAVLVAALMVYALVPDVFLSGGAGTGDEAWEVAVFLPERRTWNNFRLGLLESADRLGTTVLRSSGDTMVIRAPRSGRLVRFRWHGVRGQRPTRDALARLLAAPGSPVAVVGSETTLMTVALAEELREATVRDPSRPAPVLLVPFATAVRAEEASAGSGPGALLDIYPGRTFRFCPNNDAEADLVVRAVLAHAPGQRPPDRVFLVIDEHDPYSLDLARSFGATLASTAPDAALVEQPEALGSPSLGDQPGAQEYAWAEALWRSVAALNEQWTAWVVLPLQGDPSRRLLTALRSHAPADGAERLQVVCGDGIGLETMANLAAGGYPLWVWCVSGDSVAADDAGIAANTQTHAEIVTAVLLGLDAVAEARADDLAQAIRGLRLEASAALGRSLAFDEAGERVGEDLGHVLAVGPGRSGVVVYVPEPGGRWRTAEPSMTVGLLPMPGSVTVARSWRR